MPQLLFHCVTSILLVKLMAWDVITFCIVGRNIQNGINIVFNGSEAYVQTPIWGQCIFMKINIVKRFS